MCLYRFLYGTILSDIGYFLHMKQKQIGTIPKDNIEAMLAKASFMSSMTT